MSSLPAFAGLTLFTLLRLSSPALALSTLPRFYTFFSAPSTPSILGTPTYFLGITCLVIGTGSDVYTLVALLRTKPIFNLGVNIAPLVLFLASRILLSFTPEGLEGKLPAQTPRGCLVLLNVIVIFHALLATFTIQGFVDGRRMRRESWAGEEFERDGWSVDSK